ncbi:MAG TPA: class I adenylate-forming enzyme family protein [Bacteroidales bacterium]|nr:class I adenylate-forming enzyme family protein [Bacteroidales bacterium]
MEKRKDVRQLIIDAAEKFNNKTAFVYNDVEYSFAKLQNDVFKLANGLLNLGLRKGDKVAIYLPNCIEYAYSYYAIYSTGLVVIPIDFFLTDNEIISIGNHCELKAIITTENVKFDLKELKDAIPTLEHIITIEKNTNYHYFWDLINNSSNELADQGIDISMPSSIFYTSGVTGKPKGALWNYEHIHLGAEQMKEMGSYEKLLNIVKIDVTERSVAPIPFSHSAGLLYFMIGIKYGMSTVIMPRFAPLELVKLIKKWGATNIFMAPAMFYAVLTLKEIENYSLDTLIWATVFGAPSSPDLMMKFAKLCPNAVVLNGYGLTEVIPPLAVSSPQNIKGFSYIVSNINLKLVDSHDKEVKKGEIGEVIVKGKSVFCGYYNEPQLNEQVFKNGWFYTGDLGYFDNDNTLYLIGKSKDIIKVGGELVWAAEIEEVLLRYPGIREAAAVGIPDPLRGEVVKCYVAPADSTQLNKNDLLDYLRKNLAKFKQPKDIIILDDLPKTGPGKINKTALKELG